MLNKKDKNGSTPAGQTLNTIIGRGTSFEGKMKVENSVRVDGYFKGELACSGSMTISQTGEAEAELDGKDIYINGTVRGTVRAEKVKLDTQARFSGDIHTGILSVTEGAVFDGKCAMDSKNQKPGGAQDKAQAAPAKGASPAAAVPEKK